MLIAMAVIQVTPKYSEALEFEVDTAPKPGIDVSTLRWENYNSALSGD